MAKAKALRACQSCLTFLARPQLTVDGYGLCLPCASLSQDKLLSCIYEAAFVEGVTGDPKSVPPALWPWKLRRR